MRKKLYAILLFILILSEIVNGKENKSKSPRNKKSHPKEKPNNDRIKRSLEDDDDKPFWANRGKKQKDDTLYSPRYENVLEKTPKVREHDNFVKEPFWGTRGRRDSSSYETYFDDDYDYDSNCEYFNDHRYGDRDKNFKERREDKMEPFWGNRGRRSSDELGSSEPFWGNRGRRQDSEPFWGARGRRKDSTFWGARGRRDDEPFWGNRGRRDDEPFWGTRGRRLENEPFWGNRGRRQNSEPFWGTRGRRDDEPFWGNRGRRKDDDVFWGSRGRRKEDIKQSILEAINDVENDIENLSRLKKSETPFWSNRGRDSKINNLFNGPTRNAKIISQFLGRNFDNNLRAPEPGTVHDSRIYAEEPHYIVVERSSRSSGEEDPFYISRGKKYYLNYNLVKAARDRRGAIEEIVKSVRNDPYYIARGKKDTDLSGNSTSNQEEYRKIKELICSAIELIVPKESGKVKREIDNDRDRRTILKKLAAQLQIDPYYVSRGKKSEVSNEDNLHKFVKEIAEKCV